MQTHRLQTTTSDGLILPGILHTASKKLDTCILFVHGMSGNYIENYFAYGIAEQVTAEDIDFAFTHNRGYFHTNDIRTTHGEFRRIGTSYERFADAEKDIAARYETIQSLGYKHIILCGHSLGCNKVLDYYQKHPTTKIDGIILLSPPDIVGLCTLARYEPNYKALLKEAQEHIANNTPEKLLSHQVRGRYTLSAQTFLDIAIDGCPADNLPLLRNPDTFPALAHIAVPILSVMGEKDDIEIRSIDEDNRLIQSKATQCPSYSRITIRNADHVYYQQEVIVGEEICNWIKNIK